MTDMTDMRWGVWWVCSRHVSFEKVARWRDQIEVNLAVKVPI